MKNELSHTKDLLIEQYKFNENSIEINAELTLTNGEKTNIDLLVRDKRKNPYILVVVSEKLCSKEKILEYLTYSKARYGFLRHIGNHDIPDLYGWVKYKNLLNKNIHFKEINDFPKPLNLFDKLIHFFEIISYT